jgi:hypothetical protein
MVSSLKEKFEKNQLNNKQKIFIYDRLNGLIANSDSDTKNRLTLINIEILNARNNLQEIEIDSSQYEIEQILLEAKKKGDINAQIKFLKNYKVDYKLIADSIDFDIGLEEKIDNEIEYIKELHSKNQKENLTSLTKDLITACSQLQGLNKAINGNEDSRNSFISNSLNNMGYKAKDQSQWGASQEGINPGEIDIKIENDESRTISICEGLNLSYCKSKSITSHVHKIFDYDTNGVKKNYILVYSDSKNFLGLWKKYLAFINSMEYPFKQQSPITVINSDLADIKICFGVYNRNDFETELIHIFINMNYK